MYVLHVSLHSAVDV